MLRKTEEGNRVKGFQVSSGVDSTLKISHLKYADDILVFCEANCDQVRMLRIIFILA